MEEEIESIAANALSNAENFSDFMGTIQKDLTKMLQKTYEAPADLREAFNHFASAINWNDNFIRSILAFHLVLFILFLLTRKNIDIQTVFFFFLCIIIYSSETLNSYGNLYWNEFTDQNYFDRRGIFMSIMFAGPLLVLLVIQLVSFYYIFKTYFTLILFYYFL